MVGENFDSKSRVLISMIWKLSLVDVCELKPLLHCRSDNSRLIQWNHLLLQIINMGAN